MENRKGFTLLELAIVMAIVVIMATFTLASNAYNEKETINNVAIKCQTIIAAARNEAIAQRDPRWVTLNYSENIVTNGKITNGVSVTQGTYIFPEAVRYRTGGTDLTIYFDAFGKLETYDVEGRLTDVVAEYLSFLLTNKTTSLVEEVRIYRNSGESELSWIKVGDAPYTVTISGPAGGKLNTNYVYSSTINGGKAPYTYAWEGGETPATSTGNAFTTQWATSGSKTLVLTVTDALGATTTDSMVVLITNPLTVFINGPTDLKLNTNYTYSPIINGGEAPYTYAWTSEDGNPTTGINNSYALAWATVGAKIVNLTVTDSLSQTSSYSLNVTVYSAPVVIILGTVDGKLNTDYLYTCLVTGGKASYTYAWTSDGTVASSMTSTFTTQWAANGMKAVNLTITDSLGQTGSKTLEVNIYSVPTVIISGPEDGKLSTDYTYMSNVSGGMLPYTYAWSNGGSPATGTASSFTSQWTSDGTKTINLTITDSLNQTANASFAISIYSPPMVTIAGPLKGKLNTNYTYTCNIVGGKGSYLYAWASTTGNPTTGTSATFTVAWTTAAAKTVTLTIIDSLGQPGSEELALTIYSAPTVTVEGPTKSKLNTDYTYTCTPVGGSGNFVYAWNGGGTPTTGTTSTFTTQWTATGTKTVGLTITDDLGQSADNNLAVIVYSAPTVIIADIANGKLNTNYTYTCTPSGGSGSYTYAWATSDGSPATCVSSSFLTQWATTGTKNVSLTITDSLGQTGTDTSSIVIVSALTATASGPADGKLNTNYTYTVSVSGGKTPYTYAWSGGETPTMGTASAFTTQWATTGAKTINLTVTDALGQTGTSTVTTTIASAVTVVLDGPAMGKFSTNYTYTPTISGGKTPYTYAWSGGESPATGTGTTFTTQWTATGNKTVSLTVTDALGQNSSATFAVIIYSAPTVIITGATTGKLNTTYTYTCTPVGGTGSYTYAWTSAGGTPASGINSSFDLSWATAGAKTVNLTITDSLGQTGSDNLTVTLYSVPTVIVAGATSGKLNTNYTYTCAPTGGTGSYTYAWSGGESPATGTASAFTSQWATAGTKTINLMITDSLGQTASDTLTVTLYSAPTVTIAGPGNVKMNTAYTYTCTPSGGSGSYTYAWSGGGTPATSTANSFTTQWSTGGIATTVSLTITDTLGQTGSANYGVTIYAALSSFTISGTIAGKLNTSYTYTNNESGGLTPYTYAWTGGGSPITGTNTSFATQWSSASTYTVGLTITDALGQTSSASLGVTIYSAPAVTISGSTIGKLSTVYTYTCMASGGTGSYTYAWATVGGTPASGTGTSFAPYWTSTGAKTVSLTITDGLGQTASNTYSITIYGAPTVTISGTTTPAKNTAYTYTAVPSGGSGSYTYSWTTGGYASPSSSTASSVAITWTNPTPGYIYSSALYLTITDSLGQTASASTVISIQP